MRWLILERKLALQLQFKSELSTHVKLELYRPYSELILRKISVPSLLWVVPNLLLTY